MLARHASLGLMRFEPGPGPDGAAPELLFCDNETNAERLFGTASRVAVAEGRAPRLSWWRAARRR